MRVTCILQTLLGCVLLVSAPVAVAQAPRQLAAVEAHRLQLVRPAAEQTIHDNSGRVEVETVVEPALDVSAGDRLRLRLDGTLLPGAWTKTRRTLAGIPRGEHRLQALITDRDGRTLAASDERRFYMWQASRLFPNR
jgi:hypothetical protein